MEGNDKTDSHEHQQYPEQQSQPQLDSYTSKSKNKLKFFIIIAIIGMISLSGFLIWNLVSKHDLTIEIHSTLYNGYIVIQIDGEQKFFGEISEGDMIERTFSVSSGEHSISISTDSGSQMEIINVYTDRTIRYTFD
jgi:hypothetical protein